MTPANMYLHSPMRFLNLIFIFSLSAFASNINGENFAQIEEDTWTQINQFDFLSVSSGWVLLDEQLFWTSDSGQTWNEIGPSVPPEATVQDVEFINPDTGWILWTTINADGSSNFTIAKTINRGMDWSTISPPLFESGEIAAHSEKVDMGWFDKQNGWIAVKQTSSSNFSLGTLFTTSDGGKTWIRSKLPIVDNVTFGDPQIGWVAGGPTGDQIFKTQDGGNTWQSNKPKTLSDSTFTTDKPLYVDSQGILVTTSLGEKNNLKLHVFHEVSNKWQASNHITLDVQPGILGLSIIDTNNFVAIIPGTKLIVRMRDSLFEILENQDNLSSSINTLDMISLDVGWAKSVDAKCTTASSLDDEPNSVSCTSFTRLLRTDNGGLTWQDIKLPFIRSEITPQKDLKAKQSMNTADILNVGNTETFIGQGFDKCEVPTLSQLQSWWNDSPYKTVNLYIGGSNRACANSALSNSYLNQLYQQGWKFIPTWVGPQAPCTGFLSRMSSDPATAYDQGVNEANVAVDRLAELGLTYPDKSGSVVYYDIEYYGTNANCRSAVNAFMNGWVSQIRASGNLAGVYGSTLCDTGLSDFLNIENIPDVIWPARWYHNPGEGYYDPTATVWNLGSCISNTVWANHQRIRQYEGDHNETWGDLTLQIDSNVLDGVVAIPLLDPIKISFQEIASGLNDPVFITHAGDGSGRIFVVERSGRIRIIKNGDLLSNPFLDIQSIVKSAYSEQGLLGLAFHPSYGSNGKFYVIYTAPRTGDSVGSVLTLRQYSVSTENPEVADLNSGVDIFTIDHPTYSNHNGGTIAFGNDGYLYWSTGDGGGGGDPDENAQDLTSLLGKILRLDVDSGSSYTIPATNPFYNNPNLDTKKIWAYGLRNPWRMSFDRLTHDLYIGDVGQGSREEISFQPADSTGGENYGWRVMEGSLCYIPASGCNQIGKILPVAEYSHSFGCSVTGGYVYRGINFPSLNGYYFYGDFCSGRLFSLSNSSGWESIQILNTSYNISTFGEDEHGELYLADYEVGKIYQIQGEEPSLPSPWYGGVSIEADKAVVAVGRPHIGNEVASYGGFPSGSLNVYVPMLFRDAFGGSYDSALYIQNVHASNSASVTIKYYDNNGVLNCTKADTIAPLASKGYWLPSVACDSGSLPFGWVGGVKVESDQPIVAVGRPHVGAQVMTYNGFSGGSTTSYIPMLFKAAFGGSYNAAFYLQNVHESNTANVTIKYYDNGGVLSCTKTDAIAPLASKGYWVPSVTCDTGSLPAGWVGGVKVESNQPIVGVGRPHIGSQVMTYIGFAGGGSSSYVPMLFKGAFGGSYNAAFYLQNTHESNSANITVEYYDSVGNLSCTKADTIAPLASKGYWLPSATCDSGSLPAGWVGGVVVTSDHPIVGVGRPHIGTQVTTYNGFTGGSLDSYLPMLFKGAFGGSYNAAFYVQNTENSSANVTLNFYDSEGNLSCVKTTSIPPGVTTGFWLPSLTCDP